MKEAIPYNYTLYADKYTYQFEKYCLDHGLGKKCNEGIILNKEVAFSYMSILAEIISKDMGIDMITDNRNYADPVLRARSSLGEMGISLKDVKQDCFEIKDYLVRIEGKKQARKYLAKLRQLRPETL